MDNDLVLEGWPFNKKNDDRISMDKVNKIILENKIRKIFKVLKSETLFEKTNAYE